MPAADQLNVQFKTTPGATGTVELYDIKGSRIIKQNFAGVFEEVWDTGNLESGIYFIRINSDGETLHEKVIIQR